MKKVTLPDLLRKKGAAPIVMTTCYDASFGRLAENAGIETLLVGDSLGMVIKGEESTLGVALDEVAYHVRAVRRGAPSPFLIADMPFGSYQASVEKGVESAVALMKAGAEAVKVEGGARSPRWSSGSPRSVSRWSVMSDSPRSMSTSSAVTRNAGKVRLKENLSPKERASSNGPAPS